ncbi:MAG: PilZ domain-containing protein [Kiloniellales bacterium]|nr:PilZ domain-containing protein [Kiloniellales bacterium]
MKDLVRLKLEKDERRTYARAVKFMSGCVLVADEVLNCMVIDLSVNGARLLFDRPLPDFEEATVRLALKLRLANPVDLAMRVAWRDSMLLGVTFLDDPHDVAVALEPLLPEECLSFPSRPGEIPCGGESDGSEG